MGIPPRRSAHRARRGVALVAALAFLALAAALLVGTFGAARAMSRGAATVRAAARADAAARRMLAQVIVGWEGSFDSLPVGASVPRPPSTDDGAAPPVTVDATVRRLGGGVFVIVVEARVTAGARTLARRRYRMLVERPSNSDDRHGAAAPSPVAGWSLDETN